MRTEALSNLMSWPVDLLADKGTGQPTGLLIPMFANRKNVHHLYGPKSRLKDFPRADWRFLVHAATNIAKAFASVHDANCVIGDVNHSSILVGQDATVALIDCDSFQVNAPGRRFFCEVGVEIFTPPELQRVSTKGVVRTPNFDNFGLAVMIFHLLFMGRHPFAGRPRNTGDVPIAQAIKEFRFPYSANHAAMQMDRPPGTPDLSFVGTAIAQLFEIAFSRAVVNGGRPTARDWTAALQKLEVNTKQCANNRAHWHPSHLSSCPWCEMEAQGANPLFPFVVPVVHGRTGPALDVEAMSKQLQGLEHLGPAPAIPVALASPSAAARQVGPPNRMARIFALAAIPVFNLIHKHLSNAEHVERFRKALSDAETNFNRANSDWQLRAGEGSFYDAKQRSQE
jgi:DNA-binding helix-hairpin-helix protein with protein kinase domain